MKTFMNKKLKAYKLYRQLIEVFTIREIKSRYRASILGPVWIVLHPLLTAVILSLIFGKFMRIKTDNIPYFIFIFPGLMVWNFFSLSINLSKESLIWNRELITKSAFSKSTLPLSYVFSIVPDFMVNIFIILSIFIISGYKINLSFVLILLILVPLVLFTVGISLISALTNSIFRDFGRIIDFMLMIMFYITPILYVDSVIPEKYKIILLINPLSLLIIFARKLLFYNKFEIDYLSYAFLLSGVVFIIGFLFFKKFEKRIADLI